MPIYEYECRACGHRFEILQKMSDAPRSECPDCGKPELQKLVSAAAFRLKGGGWYETDFKNGSKKNLSSGGKGDAKAAPKAKSADDKKKADGKKNSA